MGYPYTGPGVAASAICMDKGLTKDMFALFGIPTPAGIKLKKNEEDKREVPFPCVVKACCGGSSVGVAMANNEEEYENLNDLETVLDSLGIKLRENAKEWRDFDTVIQDIAEHWDNWDLTTKNAVSTAFAGTRQRENFLTLMDSWEDVGKYAEIASSPSLTLLQK